jgi:phosphate transport system protein
MSRDTFYRQVDQIQQEILLLESMVEQAVLKSVQNLKSRNLNEARQLYDDDVLLNEKRFAIENAVLILIATQQPMARDLRKLAAILEISGELERMGDYAKGISKVVLILQDTELSIPLTDIERMAKISVDMLHRAITAFVAEDIQTASQIPEGDNEVDELYNHFYRLLMDAMIANPKIIDDANHW